MKSRVNFGKLVRTGVPLRGGLRRGQHLQQRSFSRTASIAQHADERLRFPGALEAKFTTNLKFENPKEKEVIPCYRVMDSEGVIVDKSYKRDFSDEEAVKLYTTMVGVSIMDVICLDAQRQGMRNLNRELLTSLTC